MKVEVVVCFKYPSCWVVSLKMRKLKPNPLEINLFVVLVLLFLINLMVRILVMVVRGIEEGSRQVLNFLYIGFQSSDGLLLLVDLVLKSLLLLVLGPWIGGY